MRISWALPLKIALFVGLHVAALSLPEAEEYIGRKAARQYIPIAQSLLRFASLLLALSIAHALFHAAYRRQKRLSPKQQDAFLLGIRNVYYIVAAGVALAGALTLYGISLREAFTSLSIIAAALAIVFKDFIVEIIAGLVMTFSGQLAVGDYISVGAIKGKVSTLTLTKTVLLNEDDDLIHLPNSKLFSGELVNYTQRMQRRVSIEFEVALAHIPSVDDFEAALHDALSEYEDLIVPGSHSLRVVQLHKDAAEFKYRYTLHERSLAIERDIRRRTSRTIISYVQAVGRGSAGAAPTRASHLAPAKDVAQVGAEFVKPGAAERSDA